MATDQQRRFGAMPIGKPRGPKNRKLTECELECGMTAGELRAFHQEQRLRVLARYGVTPTEDAA
jgi:hypothetical protein